MKFLLKNFFVFILLTNFSLHTIAMEESKDDNYIYETEKLSISQYVEKHKDSPDDLAEIFVDIPSWEKPDLDIAEKILKLGVSPDVKKGGHVALIRAATFGRTDFVKLLLKHKANIEIQEPWDKRTALMAAALYGRDDTLKLLISEGANVNAQNCLKVTALSWASYEAKVNTVKLLLEAKAETSLKDEEGRTALSRAKERTFTQYNDRYDKIIKLLEDAGAKE